MMQYVLKWLPYAAVLLSLPSALYVRYGDRPALVASELTAPEPQVPQPLPPLSPYDPIIQERAWERKIDWRLVASIIRVESAFEPEAVSPAGAQGLMQLMPAVAREQGLRNAFEPTGNIQAGIRHLQKKFRRIRGATAEDTLRLSLAAYNAGIGHLFDAQKMARRRKRDPQRWADVRPMFLLLQKPKHYRRARHGYCRGTETVEYVDRVMGHYAQYRDTYPLRATVVQTGTSRTRRGA